MVKEKIVENRRKGGNTMNIGYAVGTIMILIGAVLIVLALIL